MVGSSCSIKAAPAPLMVHHSLHFSTNNMVCMYHFMISYVNNHDGEHGDLIPYLMSKTSLTEEQIFTVITELIFVGVDTVRISNTKNSPSN